jgi:hypothetical protein
MVVSEVDEVAAPQESLRSRRTRGIGSTRKPSTRTPGLRTRQSFR